MDHEMERDDQMIRENNLIKLLDVSMLSDATCVEEDHESECGVPQSVASSTPAVNKMPASKTPQSKAFGTSSVTESQGRASISAYEDALAELSSTKTPVLPTRSKATPLRRSARKAVQSDGKLLL